MKIYLEENTMDATTLGIIIAILSLVIAIMQYNKKEESTNSSKVFGVGDSINGDKITGDKISGDKVGRDKTVNKTFSRGEE